MKRILLTTLLTGGLLGLITTCGTEPACVTDGSDCHGQKGDPGAPGKVGTNGKDGTNGTNGSNGATGQTGAAGRDGTSGINGRDGTDGAKGDTGAQGPTGPQGQAGTPAADTYTVEFCPDQSSTVYPSHFPEYGLCVHNKIYAVYWDNTNAWLAEIAPGTYKSTATGLQCTFVVEANCVVR